MKHVSCIMAWVHILTANASRTWTRVNSSAGQSTCELTASPQSRFHRLERSPVEEKKVVSCGVYPQVIFSCNSGGEASPSKPTEVLCMGADTAAKMLTAIQVGKEIQKSSN